MYPLPFLGGFLCIFQIAYRVGRLGGIEVGPKKHLRRPRSFQWENVMLRLALEEINGPHVEDLLQAISKPPVAH